MDEDLFKNTSVIKLHDKDFKYDGDEVQLKHNAFKNKDGYVMIYAPWCPYCQSKVDFWSYMGKKFNVGEHKSENFRIGVINATDPNAQEIVQRLHVSAIPRFVHVISNDSGYGRLVDYNGVDTSPETLLGEVCQKSSHKRLCSFDINKL